MLDAGELIKIDLTTSRITLPHAPDTTKLHETIAQAQQDGGPHAFQAETCEANVAMCVCPYRPAPAFASDIDRKLFEGQQLFAVFVGAQPTGGVSARLLQDAFGLTHREAEVCRGLLGGQKPSDLAIEMGRSEKTIRNQIQAVHEKVGVTSTRDLTEALSVFRSVGAMFSEG
ncbi:MAG: LuxR C-terminal-related transcriptional regulator [Paracoccaceae bacterium]